ncbi:MAG TPA: N-acetyl-gamma-glutamyl-phosphate reductase [Terriglobales bacterium]|jgi:N-acetyl-gamma-glutamyl-phosphate reductase|nr:N-acetyl-gamma-glutamyl-phosphate reductase [Terriglobales bacterium]
MAATLKTAVLGASGYSGLELARILSRHPRTASPLLLRRTAETDEGIDAGKKSTKASSAWPQISGNGHAHVEPFSWSALKQHGVELLFLATPHAVSRELVPEAISRGLSIVDLSGAWRLKQEVHRAIYHFKDADAKAAAEASERAVYGLPELNAGQIKSATLVANPGCYATSVILALAPVLLAGWVELDRGIISDSKSGVSGAGKEPTARTHFVSVADNFSAYSVFRHRHTGEILEQLALDSAQLIFTPHLLPIPRGILSTIYVYLKRKTTEGEIQSCLQDFYAGKKWVRVFPASTLPEIQFSVHTNYCDIGFCLADDGRRLILVSCLDNLLKGAAGQAVQNMNLMYGWDEAEGLQ